ncbi:hypothetical protein [Cystobacter ferrugineus]|uniref:Uncharacterized protein n=1 Tax=Cystobacter ferrugineus TaxID=83449 RepID=A0A1L9BK80_9BACT|nr:hypothetical protein [Cystobacter ferrugineus]OJH42690.1 hypothetical protein BON30_05785 [Cystobacter ferrugineus]
MRPFSHGTELVAPPDRVDPALDALSLWARTVYRRRLDDTREALARIMVVDLYHLILIERASSETVSIAPALYTLLKDLGHSCLGVYSGILPWLRGGSVPDPAVELAPLVEHLRRGQQRFEQLAPGPEERALGGEIFALHEELLAHAASGQPLGARELEAWGRALGPRLERAFRWAAHAQVDAIHAAVTGWAASRGEEPWTNLWVVPLGPRIAREGFLQTQYFERLLGAEGARERLVFGENLAGVPDALRLLTSVVLDRALSLTLFGDPRRLEVDILAQGARERLDEIFGVSRHAWPACG